MLTVEDVEKRVAQIASVAIDDEVAHINEDHLWEEVLRHIAKGSVFSRELATAALKTKEIYFARWCS